MNKPQKHRFASMDDSAVYLTNCLASPSCCLPKHEHYSRLPPIYGGDRGGETSRGRRLWRKLFRRFVRESNKCIYGSTDIHTNIRSSPLTFQYDAVSYSQNFDEGCHHEDYRHFGRFSPLITMDRRHFR